MNFNHPLGLGKENKIIITDQKGCRYKFVKYVMFMKPNHKVEPRLKCLNLSDHHFYYLNKNKVKIDFLMDNNYDFIGEVNLIKHNHRRI